jgi:hypothetical protein
MILDLEIVKFDIFSILKANKFVIGKKVVSEIVEYYSTKKNIKFDDVSKFHQEIEVKLKTIKEIFFSKFKYIKKTFYLFL